MCLGWGGSVTPPGHTVDMKLAQWTRQHGVSRHMAARWFHAGQLPLAARQLATGAILVDQPSRSGRGEVAVSARVSASGQRPGLDWHVARLAGEAVAVRLALSRVVAEIGSAACGERSKLRRLVAGPEVGAIVAERRDRLVRFGVECVEAALASHGRQLVVLGDGEVADDLVREMVDVLISMCVRLSGRSARRRAGWAVTAAEEASP